MASKLRYIVGTMPHIFPGARTDREVRWAYDTQEDLVLAVNVLFGTGWTDATRDEYADVVDSLRSADSPEDMLQMGARRTSKLPKWASSYGGASKIRITKKAWK